MRIKKRSKQYILEAVSKVNLYKNPIISLLEKFLDRYDSLTVEERKVIFKAIKELVYPKIETSSSFDLNNPNIQIIKYE